MPLPADYLIVRNGLYVSESALEKIRLTGPPARWHDFNLIEEAMKKRVGHWKGLQRLGFENAECHICVPDDRHDDNGKRVRRSSDRLFLIYTNLQQYGDVVFDWEWRPGNEHTGQLYDQTFKEQIND